MSQHSSYTLSLKKFLADTLLLLLLLLVVVVVVPQKSTIQSNQIKLVS
jgi:hypothetical protein